MGKDGNELRYLNINKGSELCESLCSPCLCGKGIFFESIYFTDSD